MLWRGPLSAATKKAHAREICAFLRHCGSERAPATILLVQAYIQRAEPGSDEAANRERREALRWFFRAARERGPAVSRGYSSVETTQIYTHVMRKPGLGVKSPLDALAP